VLQRLRPLWQQAAQVQASQARAALCNALQLLLLQSCLPFKHQALHSRQLFQELHNSTSCSHSLAAPTTLLAQAQLQTAKVTQVTELQEVLPADWLQGE
jgi:hypothetical protein